MQKIKLAFIAVIVLALTGCASLSFNNSKTSEVLMNILARRVAYKVIKNNPTKIDEIKFYCEALQNEDITQAVIDTGINYLMTNFGKDPLLRTDLKELGGLIVLDVSSPDFKPELIRMVAKDFLDVINLLQIVNS